VPRSADDGLAALREALTAKIKRENGLSNSGVMVTSGSNQAYMNVCLSLLDQNDVALVFCPYYFNHMMALQMVTAPSSAQQLTPTSARPRHLESSETRTP
jgi:aspartate/methionine/tyrosine aminotransferase